MIVEHRCSGPTGSLLLLDHTSARCAWIEHIVDEPPTCSAASDLLNRVSGALPAEQDRPWPQMMADAMVDVFRQHTSATAWMPCALFTAIQVTPSRVIASTLGDIRVMVVRDGALVGATNDHVMGRDAEFPPFTEAVPEQLSFPTRSLCRNPTAPPEHMVLEIAAPHTVFICSSLYHRHRTPTELLPELLAGDLPRRYSGGGVYVRLENAGAIAAVGGILTT